MVNTECEKKTLFNKEINYDKSVLEKLVNMVSENRLDVTKLEDLETKELRDVANEIGITKLSKKSNIVILEELKNTARVFLAGQGKMLSKLVYYITARTFKK